MTIEVFEIKASDISKSSEKAESTISSFRKKRRELKIGGFMQLFRELPTGAQYFFLTLCLSPAPVVQKLERLREM
ncbi:MAG: hypothetical protein ACRCZS_03325 [Chroococcidiopsis sp.]